MPVSLSLLSLYETEGRREGNTLIGRLETKKVRDKERQEERKTLSDKRRKRN